MENTETQEQRVEDLVKLLHNHPIGSYWWSTYKHKIAEQLEKKALDRERILVFGSNKLNRQVEWPQGLLVPPLPSVNDQMHTETMERAAFMDNGVHQLDWRALKMYSLNIPKLDGLDSDDLATIDAHEPMMAVMNGKFSFTRDGSVTSALRSEVEHDLRYRQIIVVAVITDGNNVLMLKTNKNNRIADKLTFVQGHVTYTSDIYFRTELEYLRDSVLRELAEEIKIVDVAETGFNFESLVPERPTHVIDRDKTFADMEHFGIVYTIKIDSVDDFVSTIADSGEPDKHTLVSVSLTDNADVAESFDDWAAELISKMVN